MNRRNASLLLLLAAFIGFCAAYQTPQRIALDIASGSSERFLTGFYEAEPGFRWTTARAAIWLSGLGAGNLNWRGVLRAGGPRPEGEESSPVTVRVNGAPLGTFTPPEQERDFPFLVPAGALGANGDFLLEIESDTFTAEGDPRELGVRVVSLWLEPEGGPALPSLKVLGLGALVALGLWGTTKVVAANGVSAAATSAVLLSLTALGVFVSRVEATWWLSLAALGALLLAITATLIAWIVPRSGMLALERAMLTSRKWRGVLALFGLAALVRLVLDTGRGYEGDVAIYLSLAWKTVTYGIHAAYETVGEVPPPNTPPLLLYPFWLAGMLYRQLFSPVFPPTWIEEPSLLRFLLRMPSLIADLAAGALILRATAGMRSRPEPAAPRAKPADGVKGRAGTQWWLPAAAYLFNPALLFDGAYWGQTAAIHSLWMLASLLAVARGRHGWAGAALALAVLTKPQALAIAPLVLLVAWQAPRGGGTGNPRAVLRFALGGIAATLAVAAPFVLGGTWQGVIAQYAQTAEYHPYLSVNAHNLWWLVTGGVGWQPDLLGVGAISYRMIGIALFALATLFSLAAVWRAASRADDNSTLMLAAAFQSLAFFLLLTQIHENHALPLFAPLALACAGRRAPWSLYAGLAVTALANMALHDPALVTALGFPVEEIYGGEGLAAPRLVNAAAQCAFFVWMMATLLGRGPRRAGG